MLDLKFVRENPDIVKKNIENKFQFEKLPLVDEVIELDAKNRASKAEADNLRASRNKLSKQIGQLMGQGKKDEAEEVKAQVAANAARLAELEAQETELEAKVLKIMMTIPNIIDPSVPIGKDDSQNVEIEKFGDPFVPDFEIPYHTDIMKTFDGIDLDAAGKVAGNGFYYLMGDIARLHSAVIAYARDFMINSFPAAPLRQLVRMCLFYLSYLDNGPPTLNFKQNIVMQNGFHHPIHHLNQHHTYYKHHASHTAAHHMPLLQPSFHNAPLPCAEWY